ncbi:hypothetical protein L7F22_005951 [Adiantum nelumboides]|nr:hypothetical protein [Adiantum nelumboides]
MYARCGALQKSQKVLEEVDVRDAVSWSALIAGYAQQGQWQEALGYFHRMLSEGISLDAITYECILKACGTMKDTKMGKRIHDHIISKELLRKKVLLGTDLVNLYAKCVVLHKALKVLEDLPVINGVSWSVLIVGFYEQD